MLGANGLVGDGNPIAVGAGYSIKLRNSKQIAVSFFGDGASNQGTFHESLNMAASWNLPVIFVLENNRVSCGVHTSSVCNIVENLGDRAIGYNIPGENINGMDVIEVYETVKKAVERARNGKGPTLINCRTFRHHGHFEGDIDIRSKEEVEYALTQNAVEDFEKRMIDSGIIDQAAIDWLRGKIQAQVDEAVEFARNSPVLRPEDSMKFVYSE